jgi:hypothetical protein
MPALPARPLAAMSELVVLFPVRNLELRARRTLNIARTSNLEAYLGQFVGEIRDNKCIHCTRGSGPWVGCVVVETLLNGSCCNCYYNNEGPRYSLRKFRPVLVLLWLC